MKNLILFLMLSSFPYIAFANTNWAPLQGYYYGDCEDLSSEKTTKDELWGDPILFIGKMPGSESPSEIMAHVDFWYHINMSFSFLQREKKGEPHLPWQFKKLPFANYRMNEANGKLFTQFEWMSHFSGNGSYPTRTLETKIEFVPAKDMILAEFNEINLISSGSTKRYSCHFSHVSRPLVSCSDLPLEAKAADCM